MTQTNMEVLVSFLVFPVIVCAWLTTRKMCGRLASVGLAQACPNYLLGHSGWYTELTNIRT